MSCTKKINIHNTYECKKKSCSNFHGVHVFFLLIYPPSFPHNPPTYDWHVYLFYMEMEIFSDSSFCYVDKITLASLKTRVICCSFMSFRYEWCCANITTYQNRLQYKKGFVMALYSSIFSFFSFFYICHILAAAISILLCHAIVIITMHFKL